MEDTRRTMTSESIEQDSYKLRDWSSKNILYMDLHIYYIFQLIIFMGLLFVWTGGSLTLGPTLKAFFPSVGIPWAESVWWFWFDLILYVVKFSWYLVEACSSLMRCRKGDDPEGKGSRVGKQTMGKL